MKGDAINTSQQSVDFVFDIAAYLLRKLIIISITQTIAGEHIMSSITQHGTNTVNDFTRAANFIYTINLQYSHVILSMPVSERQYSHNHSEGQAPYSCPHPIRSTISGR